MLPSDFSPEKQARQRFLKREADIREAKKIAQKTGKTVPTGMRERFEFRMGDSRPKTADSWIEVASLGKVGDFWVVDRVFPRKDEADRIAGPFRKKRQAINKGKDIVRETGEKLFLDPDGPDGPLPRKRIGG